jgi:pteridine reductase
VKLALVTGGHRRLGAAISARLAADGWTLALHGARDATPEPALAAVLGDWHGFVADLSDAAAVAGLLPEVRNHFGRAPSLLVNNASMFEWDDVEHASPGTIADHHAVNAAAPVTLALAMADSGADAAASGSIVNILDQRIRNPNRDQLSYTLSKTALAGATRTLAVALAPGLRVNAVAPGLTMPTPEYSTEQVERVVAAMPLGVLPRPEDVAEAVAYFAGAEAVTGQTLFVDGGANLKSFERDFLYI